MADTLVTTSRDRRMGLSTFGDPMSRRNVVMFHPSPGASGFDPDPLTSDHWGVRVLAFDRPGWGSSEPLQADESASFGRHADDVARYIRQTELEAHEASDTDFGRIGVVGWGTGALAAAAFASRHSRLVDRLALIDMPHAPEPSGPTDIPFGLADLGVAPDDPTLHTHPGSERRLLRMLDDAAAQGDAGLRFDRDAVRAADAEDAFGRIDVDTILVYGDDHPTLSAAVDGKELRRRMPHARVVRVQDARALSIVAVWPRILDHLAPQHGGLSSRVRR